jgi:hypothetical protein
VSFYDSGPDSYFILVASSECEATRVYGPYTGAQLKEKLAWDDNEDAFEQWGHRQIVDKLSDVPRFAEGLELKEEQLVIIRGVHFAPKAKKVATVWEIP